MQKFWLFILAAIILICGCTTTRDYMDIPEGVATAEIMIKSEPTATYIYIDGIYLGKTPIKTRFWYNREKLVNIKAIPIYDNQFPQNIYLKIPPVPDKMTVYMDHKFLKDIDYSGAEINDPESDSSAIYLAHETIKIDTLWQPFIMPAVYFKTDEYKVENLSAEELQKISELIKILRDFPEYDLVLIGNTDERGSSEYNRELAQKRVQAIFDLLLRLGAEENRMVVMIRGEQMLTDAKGEALPMEIKRSVQFELKKK